MSYDDEYRLRKPGGIWHFLNRLLVILVVLAGITLVISLFLPKIQQQREQTARYEELKKQIETQRAITAQHTREVDLLKNDPGYVEILARDRLDLMKEGETVFRMEPPATSGSAKVKLRTQ